VSGGGLAAWRRAHADALADCVRRLLSRPWGSLLTIAVLALAIALPLCLGGLVKEAERFSGSLRDSRDMAVFLDPAGDADAAERLAESLRADPRIHEVQLRSPEEGLAELRSQGDLAPALLALEHNPLPWVLLVVPARGVDDHALAEALRQREGVDQVQHDARWRERLAAWLAVAQRLAAIAAVLLGSALLLVIGNTVRLEIEDRAEEILTLRLLGASDAYVRRPFLYLGASYGLLAGVSAVALTLGAARAVAPALERLVDSYGGGFRLLLWPTGELAAVVLLAAILGTVGARVAVGHHLRQAESSA